MSVDWHYWKDDPPPPLVPILATYSLERDWMEGHKCKRGCCFYWKTFGENMVLPNFWKYPPASTGPT